MFIYQTQIEIGPQLQVSLSKLYEATSSLIAQSSVLKQPWGSQRQEITNALVEISLYSKKEKTELRKTCNGILNSAGSTLEQKQVATFVIMASCEDLSSYMKNGKFQEADFERFYKGYFHSDELYSYAKLAADLRLWDAAHPIEKQPGQEVFFTQPKQTSTSTKKKKERISVSTDLSANVTGLSKDDPYGHGHTYTGYVPPLSLTETPYYLPGIIYVPGGLVNASLLPYSEDFSKTMQSALAEIGGRIDYNLGKVILPDHITGDQYNKYISKLSKLSTWANTAKDFIQAGLNSPSDFGEFVSRLTTGKFDKIPELLNLGTQNGRDLKDALGTDLKSVSVSFSPFELAELAKFSVEGRVYVDMTMFETEKFKGDLFVYFSNSATWIISEKEITNLSRFGLKGMVALHDLELSPNTSVDMDVNVGGEIGVSKDNKPQFSVTMGTDATLYYKSLFASIGASAVGLLGEQSRLYKEGYFQVGIQPSNRFTLSGGVTGMDFRIPAYKLEMNYKLSPHISVGLEGRYQGYFKVVGNIGFTF